MLTTHASHGHLTLQEGALRQIIIPSQLLFFQVTPSSNGADESLFYCVFIAILVSNSRLYMWQENIQNRDVHERLSPTGID